MPGPVNPVRDLECQRNWEDIYGLLPQPVTVIPPTARDGQRIEYSPVAGVRWSFVYNEKSASTYKWEFTGGAGIQDETNADETVDAATTTYTTNKKGGGSLTDVSVVIPFDGDYDLHFGARMYPWAVTQTLFVAVNGCGQTAADNDSAWCDCANSKGENGSRQRRVTLTAGTLTLYYKHDNAGGDGNFRARYLKVTPVRVKAA